MIKGISDTTDLAHMKPIKFFVGHTPISLDPGFSCHVNVYHVGKLEGSLRVTVCEKSYAPPRDNRLVAKIQGAESSQESTSDQNERMHDKS